MPQVTQQEGTEALREARVPISNPEPSPLHQVSALSASGHSHLRKIWHTGGQGLDQLNRDELEHRRKASWKR